MGKLDGRVAIVTGAARGQGRSHALTFAREGADIVAIDACAQMPDIPYELGTEEDLRETERLVAETGRRCLTAQVDCRDWSALEAAVSEAVGELGRVDALCVNHGVFSLGTWESGEDEWDTIVDCDLKAVWLACKAAIPHLIANEKGAIVITASAAGLQGYYGALAYTAAKHGAIGIMRNLAAELGVHNIRVNAVCPTIVNTPMVMNEMTMSLFAGGKAEPDPEEVQFPMRNMHLLPTPWLETADISNAMLWLVSDEARYVTGVALSVDAGQLAQPPGIPLEATTRLAELNLALDN